MNYTLITGTSNVKNNKPTLRDINIAIDSLDINNKNPFIVLEPQNDLIGYNFLQVLIYNNYERKKIDYRVEYRIEEFKEPKQYKYITNDIKKVKALFEDYFLHQKSPDISSWTDVLKEIENEKYICDYISLLKVAKKYKRRNNKIFNLKDIFHGYNINGTIFYQSITEAMLLFFDILNNYNEKDNIYYSANDNRYYINIFIPQTWNKLFNKAFNITRYITENRSIMLSYYDKENMFIEHNIKPLSDMNRLIPCFILLFLQSAINNDNLLLESMKYYSLPIFEKFINIYYLFFKTLEDKEYYVRYEDFNSYDEDLDYEKFNDIKILFNNFRDNFTK